jgi:hypothetical protein
MTYEEWQLKLIHLIVDENRVKGNKAWKLDEIHCVLTDDFQDSFAAADTPEEAWQGEIDAIGDSQ